MGDFEYTHLDPEAQENLLNARLRSLEEEHFSHAMNRQTYEIAEDISDEVREARLGETDNALATIERAIENHREKLADVRKVRRAAREKK